VGGRRGDSSECCEEAEQRRDCACMKVGWLYGMVWYGMVNVDLYSAIITKVSNALVMRTL